MKEYLISFFKDKFNIILSLIQVMALILLAFFHISLVCTILFFVLESAFFVCWGIKIMIHAKRIKNNEEFYSQLPYTEMQVELLKKSAESEIKNSKFRGLMFIFLGVILLFTLLSSIV